MLHKGRVLVTGAVPRAARADRHDRRRDAFGALTGTAHDGDGRMTISSPGDRAAAGSPRRYGGAGWTRSARSASAATSTCFNGIVWREVLRFLHQRERFVSALVRPLVWLFIFAAGFRQVLGVSIIPPYETYVLYEVYITPGLIGMIQLFNGMQSLAVDGLRPRDGHHAHAAGQPVPALVPAAVEAARRRRGRRCCRSTPSWSIAWFWEIEPPPLGYLTVLPALDPVGPDAGRARRCSCPRSIKQLENFAGVMNFVIFPMFFASSALYPLWRVKESSLAPLSRSAASTRSPTRSS